MCAGLCTVYEMQFWQICFERSCETSPERTCLPGLYGGCGRRPRWAERLRGALLGGGAQAALSAHAAPRRAQPLSSRCSHWPRKRTCGVSCSPPVWSLTRFRSPGYLETLKSFALENVCYLFAFQVLATSGQILKRDPYVPFCLSPPGAPGLSSIPAPPCPFLLSRVGGAHGSPEVLSVSPSFVRRRTSRERPSPVFRGTAGRQSLHFHGRAITSCISHAAASPPGRPLWPRSTGCRPVPQARKPPFAFCVCGRPRPRHWLTMESESL